MSWFRRATCCLGACLLAHKGVRAISHVAGLLNNCPQRSRLAQPASRAWQRHVIRTTRPAASTRGHPLRARPKSEYIVCSTPTTIYLMMLLRLALALVDRMLQTQTSPSPSALHMSFSLTLPLLPVATGALSHLFGGCLNFLSRGVRSTGRLRNNSPPPDAHNGTDSSSVASDGAQGVAMAVVRLQQVLRSYLLTPVVQPTSFDSSTTLVENMDIDDEEGPSNRGPGTPVDDVAGSVLELYGTREGAVGIDEASAVDLAVALHERNEPEAARPTPPVFPVSSLGDGLNDSDCARGAHHMDDAAEEDEAHSDIVSASPDEDGDVDEPSIHHIVPAQDALALHDSTPVGVLTPGVTGCTFADGHKEVPDSAMDVADEHHGSSSAVGDDMEIEVSVRRDSHNQSSICTQSISETDEQSIAGSGAGQEVEVSSSDVIRAVSAEFAPRVSLPNRSRP